MARQNLGGAVFSSFGSRIRSICFYLVGLGLCYFFVLIPLYSLLRFVNGLTMIRDASDFAELPSLRSLVSALRDPSSMALIASIVDRLIIREMSSPGETSISDVRLDVSSPILGIMLDVSHSGEASYILRRASMRKPKERKYEPLVVDVGANDGVLSSNSFNLIQTGWSAILVEPNPELLNVAKKMTQPLVDVYRDGNQRICYVQAAMSGGTAASKMKLKIGTDIVSMESSLVRGAPSQGDKKREAHLARLRGGGGGGSTRQRPRTIEVDVLPAQDVATRCNGIPRRFGVLSVDAEGVGDLVLHDFLDNGYRPEFIIYEPMHNSEPWEVTLQYLEGLKYKWLQKRGWNHILEYLE